MLSSVPKSIRIKEGDAQQMTFFNVRKGTLILQKQDSVSGVPLVGAEFLITTIDGEYLDDNEGRTSTKGVYVTDSNGEIRLLNLEPNTYVIKETKAPDGYVQTQQELTVKVNVNDTQTVTVLNTPRQTVVIQKFVDGTTTPLAGVTFLVTDGKDNPVGSASGEHTTDANGRIVLNGLTPGTTLVAKEVRTAKEYVLNGSAQTIVVGESGTTTATTPSTGNVNTGGSGFAQQNTATHTQTAQPGAAQNGGQRWAPAGQPVDVAPDDAEAAAMEGGAPITYASAQTQPSDAGASQERRSSVPPGTVRSPSHVKQGGGAKVKGVNTNNVKNSSANYSRNTSVRPGQALPGAAAYGTDTNDGKNGAAGTGGTSGMRTGLGSGGAPRAGMAETGTPSNVRMAADKSGTSQPGTAGTGAAAETRSVTGKGVMPQPGLAGAISPVRDKAGASQPGTAGTGETAGTRKTSVDG